VNEPREKTVPTAGLFLPDALLTPKGLFRRIHTFLEVIADSTEDVAE
jgi:hypothetical protein